MNVKVRVFGLPGKPVDPQRAAAWLKKLHDRRLASEKADRQRQLDATRQAEDGRGKTLLDDPVKQVE